MPRKTRAKSPPPQAASAGYITFTISSDPIPKPITTRPVTAPPPLPNHLATVATGVT